MYRAKKLGEVMLERLLAAANQLFEKFWLIILIALPFLLIIGFIKQHWID